MARVNKALKQAVEDGQLTQIKQSFKISPGKKGEKMKMKKAPSPPVMMQETEMHEVLDDKEEYEEEDCGEQIKCECGAFACGKQGSCRCEDLTVCSFDDCDKRLCDDCAMSECSACGFVCSEHAADEYSEGCDNCGTLCSAHTIVCIADEAWFDMAYDDEMRGQHACQDCLASGYQWEEV